MVGAFGAIAVILYALLQRNKKQQAESKAKNKQKAQDISKAIDASVEEQRKEARDNEEQVREDVSNRRASLNNDRLRNTKRVRDS